VISAMNELQELQGSMRKDLFISPESLAAARDPSARSVICIADNSDLTDDAFSAIWNHGLPLLVTGLNQKLQLPWSPDYLSENHGNDWCFIESCEDRGVIKQVRLKEFFHMYSIAPEDGTIWKLKVISSFDHFPRNLQFAHRTGHQQRRFRITTHFFLRIFTALCQCPASRATTE
jgi:hypothetical protein